MATIAFIGLGNMGNPMAANLVKADEGDQIGRASCRERVCNDV